MVHSILTSAATYMFWFRQVLYTLVHTLSAPADESFPAADATNSNFLLPRSPGAAIIKAVWEARAFTAGAFLGLVAIFVVYYSRSPWRKLPPGPRGLPIIGNALQVMDMTWLISKVCKERFGKDSIVYSRMS
jgi:hypothetical protein